MVLAAGLLGCTRGPAFTYDKGDARVLVASRTLALAPGAPTLVLAEGYAEIPDPVFVERVQELMGQQGLDRTAPDQADLWLSVHLLVKQSPGAGRTGREGGKRGGQSGGGKRGGGGKASGGMGGGSRESGASAGPAHEAGGQRSPGVKVVLELNDRVTGARVWAGAFEARLQEPLLQLEGRAELDALLMRLVAPLRR